MTMTRRAFMAAAATTAAGTAAVAGAQGAAAPASAPRVCVFSKHLQFLDYAALAKTCKDLGLDGVDLTVRAGGHVEPDKLGTDLPRAVEAMRSEGLEVPMISTRLTKGSDPDARPILEAAGRLGIRYVRVDGGRYAETGNPLEELPKFTEDLRGLAALAKETGTVVGLHNHSGARRVGSVLWDLHHMLTAIGMDSIGSNFDVGHASVVGGLGAWDLHARLMAGRVKMMAVKDFVWEGEKVRWVPLGQGIVKTVEILRAFREAGFGGPVSLHFEYDTPNNEALLEEIRSAAERLRGSLREAGYA